MVLSSLRETYWKQKSHARRRGIEFLLSYEDWITWWGGDIEKRGRGLGKLQMCRYGDKGPYSLDNIFKGTHEKNSSDKFENGFKGRHRCLDEGHVVLIHNLLNRELSTRTIAKILGVSQRSIMRVKKGQDAYGKDF